MARRGGLHVWPQRLCSSDEEAMITHAHHAFTCAPASYALNSLPRCPAYTFGRPFFPVENLTRKSPLRKQKQDRCLCWCLYWQFTVLLYMSSRGMCTKNLLIKYKGWGF